MKIITHPGQAHRDEFMACCLLLATRLPIEAIQRREPTTEEMDYLDTIVVDVGGKHEPDRNNFDQHQLPRDAAPTCALSLVLPLCGVDIELAKQIWVWFSFTELLDSKGPFAAAKDLGISRDSLERTLSPVETTVLRWFAAQDFVRPGDPLWDLMKLIGQEKLEYYNKLQTRMAFLQERAILNDVGGLSVLNVMCVEPWDEPSLAVEQFLRQRSDLDCPVVVSLDDRQPTSRGICLFRRNDDPRVDLSRLEGQPGVVFAHKGGFVAKLAATADWKQLLSQAIVPKPAAD